MIYRALKSFSGKISMRKGEERAITDRSVIADLFRAGYIEAVNQPEKPKQKKEK